MKNLKSLLNQLKEIFDLDILYSNKKINLKISPALKIAYEIDSVKIGFVNFLAVSSKTDEDYSIKRLEILQSKSEEPILYIQDRISKPTRVQLTKARISYASSIMIYLYPLLCLKDQTQVIKKKRHKLPIRSQLILLYMIYNRKNKKQFELEDIRHLYKQTDSTIYRNIQALEELDLIKLYKNGQKKEFIINEDISFRELLQSMNTPVKKITYIYNDDYNKVMQNKLYLYAGESALNRFNLAVGTKTFALFYQDMSDSKWDKCNYSSHYYEDYHRLELWHYNPKLIIDGLYLDRDRNEVDSISLYLSLGKRLNIDDIRVDDAISDLYYYRWCSYSN